MRETWPKAASKLPHVWPSRAVTSDPVSMFQTRTVLSLEPDSSRVPSDRSKQMHLTFARWPVSSECIVLGTVLAE